MVLFPQISRTYPISTTNSDPYNLRMSFQDNRVLFSPDLTYLTICQFKHVRLPRLRIQGDGAGNRSR